MRTRVAFAVALLLATTAVSATTAMSAAITAAAPPMPLVFEQRVIASNPVTSGEFGFRTALDGTLLAVHTNTYNAQKITIYRRGAVSWSPAATIALAGNAYVGAMDLDGTTLVAGFPNEKLVRMWSLADTAHIPVPATIPSGVLQFGVAVAVSGNELVVGTDPDVFQDPNARRAFVYERSGSTWSAAPGGTLLPPGAVSGWFGRDTVDISGDRALVADAAGAYIYRRNPGGWVYETKITPPGAQLALQGGAQISNGVVTLVDRYVGRVSVATPPSTSTTQVALLNANTVGGALDGPDLYVLTTDAVVHSFQLQGATWVAGGSTTVPYGPDGWDATDLAPYHQLDASGGRVAVGSQEAQADGVYNSGAVYLLARGVTAISPPSAPTAVSVTPSATSGAATVRWAPPTNLGGAPITKYLVAAVGANYFSFGPQITVPATARQATISGLLEFGSYRFTVKAVNAAGTGPAATSAGYTVGGPAKVASPASFSDPLGDVVDPRFDITRYSVEHSGGRTTIRVHTAKPVDPYRDPLFQRPGNLAVLWISLRTPAEPHRLLIQHRSTENFGVRLPGELMQVRVYAGATCSRAIFPVRVVDGDYQVTIPDSCIGNPSSLRVSPQTKSGIFDSTSWSAPVVRSHGQVGDTRLTSVVANHGARVAVGPTAAVDFDISVTASDPSGIAAAWARPFNATNQTSAVRVLSTSCATGPAPTRTCTSHLRTDPHWLRNNDAGTWTVFAQANARDHNLTAKDNVKSLGIVRASKLPVTSAPAAVHAGSKIALTGRLFRANWDAHSWVGTAGAPVQLLFRKSGTSSYLTKATGVTGTTGSISLTATVAAAGTWRLRYGGDSITQSALSAPVTPSLT